MSKPFLLPVCDRCAFTLINFHSFLEPFYAWFVRILNIFLCRKIKGNMNGRKIDRKNTFRWEQSQLDLQRWQIPLYKNVSVLYLSHQTFSMVTVKGRDHSALQTESGIWEPLLMWLSQICLGYPLLQLSSCNSRVEKNIPANDKKKRIRMMNQWNHYKSIDEVVVVLTTLYLFREERWESSYEFITHFIFPRNSFRHNGSTLLLKPHIRQRGER